MSEAVIAACMEVHACLGPGLYESVYEECLARELELRGIEFARQVNVPVTYKGLVLDVAFRLDLLVGNRLIVELKAVDLIQTIHLAQLRSYMRATGLSVGLIVNFNVGHLRNGLRRLEAKQINPPSVLPPPPPSR